MSRELSGTAGRLGRGVPQAPPPTWENLGTYWAQTAVPDQTWSDKVGHTRKPLPAYVLVRRLRGWSERVPVKGRWDLPGGGRERPGGGHEICPVVATRPAAG
ncbi:hypothetical protein GTS_52820 [Gandjariella thermophila]|uniref:Uncharacterized protein n=1 Tax=Gandjariella thermophila TaxID=1931992 RepID=A0A4D4JH80_9PSEU|nr:hypothetical protein GTS_52820 [Gandjariella thermophila]